MRRIITTLMSVLMLLPFVAEGSSTTRIDSLVNELDTVINNRSHYFEVKENRISTLKSSLAEAGDDKKRDRKSVV